MSDDACVVCMEVPKFWAWSDCTVGSTPVHKACVCWPCMVQVVEGKKEQAKCPWCRGSMTTVQKVTSALIEAGASTQDALESIQVATPRLSSSRRLCIDCRARGIAQCDACLQRGRWTPLHLCMDCGIGVYFRRDRCPPCQARWRHGRVITGQLSSPSQGPCLDCGCSMGTGGSCTQCYAHRTRERISAQSTRAGEAAQEQGLMRWADRLAGALVATVTVDGHLSLRARDRILASVADSVLQERTTRQDTTDEAGVGLVVTGFNLNVARLENGTASLRFAN